MYLVRDDQNSVFVTDPGQVVQLFRRPYSAAGVVRITEDQHLAIVIGYDPAKILQIHFVLSVPERQGIVDHTPPQRLRNKPERVVHRRLYNDLIPFFRECIDGKGNPFDHTGHKTDLFCFHLPAVMPPEPIEDRICVRFRWVRITEDAMRYPLL